MDDKTNPTAEETGEEKPVQELDLPSEAKDKAVDNAGEPSPAMQDGDTGDAVVAEGEAQPEAAETPEHAEKGQSAEESSEEQTDDVALDDAETPPMTPEADAVTSSDTLEDGEEESYETIPFAQEFDLSPEAIANLENLTEQVIKDGETDTPSAMEIVTEASFGSTRQLPTLESVSTDKTRVIDYGFARNIGRVRQNNEDSLFVLATKQLNVQENPDFSLFIVADGAGGHADGEKASAVISRTMAKIITERIYQPMLLQIIDTEAEPLPPITEVLNDAVLAADEKAREEVPGGGSTLTTVVLIGDLAHIAHVGDSRAYLMLTDEETHETRMEQLTRDHSVAKRLEEIGQISAVEAVGHPEAGRLWKIMGLTENLEPDISMRRIPPKSHLLLCSDGLWNMVEEDVIKNTILQASTAQNAADRLVEAANSNGGLDNIAVIVLQVP